MARRDHRANAPTRADRAPSRPLPSTTVAVSRAAEGDDGFARVGEGLRRAALGLAALLFVTRAFFPSEDADTGTGLAWIVGMLAASGLAAASFLFAGSMRVRWSWADGAVLALVGLVGLSATHAADRRPAITMAWEWGALGLLYLLVRNLPRTRAESTTLLGVVMASAVAVSVYGLYQVPVEFPRLREMYRTNPGRVLAWLGIAPGSSAVASLENRLLNSNEVFSTFALANSLAGFLVGPMALGFAVALENLKAGGRGSRLVALTLAAVPGLAMVTCLMMTKSRSAYVGLFVALLVLAWRARRALPKRVLMLSGAGLAVLVGTLVVGGLATKQLDSLVLTQSSKSLRYRWEYWVGAWGVITDAPSPFADPGAGVPARSGETFWSGVGPANFAMPYLGHKLPGASEEIQDPHNMILEVWATAGAVAMLALIGALGWGLREILGPGQSAVGVEDDGRDVARSKPGVDHSPSRSGWLLVTAGFGWLGVWALGKLNPMAHADLLARWLMLGMGWAVAVVLGWALWRRRAIPAAGAGVAVLGVAINLLAAGGIGMPSVAMSLWVLLAVGLNLRDDRPCGRLREVGGLGASVGLACIWAAVAGTFFGAVWPFWKSEADRATGDALMAARPPAFELARKAYQDAIQADKYNVKPWIALADLEFAQWRTPEISKRKEPRWERVILALDGALDKNGRNPNSLGLRRRQASYAREILRELPADANPFELIQLKGKVVQAFREATHIYPTNPNLRADLAQASAEISMFGDAAREARQAILLDSLTDHEDKKLPKVLRAYLDAQIPLWDAKAKEPPPERPSAKKGTKPGGPK